jgi:hypothetical protein
MKTGKNFLTWRFLPATHLATVPDSNWPPSGFPAGTPSSEKR